MMEYNDNDADRKRSRGAELVESLATLMPRKPDSRFRRLAHRGVNAEGSLAATAGMAGARPTGFASTILMLTVAHGTFHTPYC